MTPDHRGILSRTHLFSVLSDGYEIRGMLCVSLPLTLLVSYYVSSCHYATTPIRQSYLLICCVPLISVFPLATTASAGFHFGAFWRLIISTFSEFAYFGKRIEAGRRCIRIFHLPLWNSCGPDSQSPPMLVVLPIQLSPYHINRFVALGTSQWCDCYWKLLLIRSIKDDSVEISILSKNIKTYTMLWVVPLSGESQVKLSSGKVFCYVRFSTLLRACHGLGMAQILARWNAKPLSWKWVQVMTRIDYFI